MLFLSIFSLLLYANLLHVLLITAIMEQLGSLYLLPLVSVQIKSPPLGRNPENVLLPAFSLYWAEPLCHLTRAGSRKTMRILAYDGGLLLQNAIALQT